jgi:hypothetical protein
MITGQELFAQFNSDGFYLWNSTHVTGRIHDNFNFDFANKDQYNTQLNRLDFYYLDLTAYRKLTGDFSVGLGVRRTQSYKLTGWKPANSLMVYGVLFLNPGSVKIKFANRVTAKVYRNAETIYGLDNITNVDFFTHSARKFPKPYLMDEIFSDINAGRIQTVRIYGGFRLLKIDYFGFDIFYCYWKSNSGEGWKEFHVLGMNTRFYI